MYLEFYGLREQPFNLTPDSKFLFFSRRHREAFAALLYGIQERKGFICLSGEIGSGKTTLYRTLISQLDKEQYKISVILNSYLTDLELLKTINQEYGLPEDSDSKKALLDTLNRFLVEQFTQGKNCLLILDEAQNLRPETLEQIRMISNLETETDKLIQIIMVGQPELRRTLALPELEQLNQRITVRHHVTPLSENEVADYIYHRLRVAGAQVNIDFTPQSLRLIYHYSRGVPRRINVICDRCLLYGYVTSRHDIDGDMVQQAVDEIRGEDRRAFDEETQFDAKGNAKGAPWLKYVGQAMIPVALLLIVAAGVWLGATLKEITSRGNYGPQAMAAAPRPAEEEPSADEPAEDEEPAPEPAKTPKPKKGDPTPPPADASAKGTPAPAPTPFKYRAWEMDRDKIVRVQREDHTNAAAHLILLRAWGIEAELEPFAEADANDVAHYDLGEMVKQANFDTFRTTSLLEAIKLDLPMLVRFGGGAPDLPSHGTILRMQGDLFTLADPIRGLRTVKRKELEPHVQEIAILYRDGANMTGIGSGSSGEGVAEIQRILRKEGANLKDIDGRFGPKMAELLRAFQTSHKLPVTGTVDPMTGAYLSTIREPDRPRLFS